MANVIDQGCEREQLDRDLALQAARTVPRQIWVEVILMFNVTG